MADKKLYSWREGFDIARSLTLKLEPHCERIMIVGSLRRQCEKVHDIDIVLQPLPGELDEFKSFELVRILGDGWRHKNYGNKIVNGLYCDIPVDLYFATQEQWWTLVVIRTGSKEHNIKLCKQARWLGMKLHADGAGIELADGTHFVPKSEESLFTDLSLPYVEPKDR